MSKTIGVKKDRKRSVIILFSIVMTISLFFYFFILRGQQKYYHAHHLDINGIYLIKPIEIKNFNLTDTRNKKFTKENLKGHWTMIYSGFTQCEIICPTVMNSLNKMYELLQTALPNDDLPQIIFLTVDPERDSLRKLNRYVIAFNSHFIGIRGSIEATIELENQLHLIVAKMQGNTQDVGNYTFNHTPDVLLVNPEAKIQAYFTYPQQPKQMAKNYQSILSMSKVRIPKE